MEIEEIKIPESTSATSFFVYKNIIFVSNTEILKFPDILSRLGVIGQDCGGSGTFHPCQQYPNCNGYVVMYAKGIERESPSSLKDISPSVIKAYAITIIFNSLDAIELWDVCTEKESRGRGYASQILESILLFSAKSRIWLGVLFWNPEFLRAVKLYAKYGFQKPDFSNRSLSGASFPFSFLSLYWERGMQVSDQTKIIESALRLRENYMGNRGKCSIRLRFENSLLKTMFEVYSEQKIEYGGKMRIFEYVDTGASYRAARVGFSPQLEIEGSKEGFVVNVPPAPINFHTHPNICYATYGCYLGWPSSSDMASILQNYDNGQRLHMLMSREGIYFISLSLNFIRAWTSAPKWFKEGLVGSVLNFFGNVEKHRAGSDIPFAVANETLSTFLTGVNKFSTNDALDWIRSQGHDVSKIIRNKATAVPIFNVLYLNWIDIDRTPIIEFDFHYISSDSSANGGWPNKCDVFEKATSDQEIAYSGSELLKLSKRK
jgi:ribosomal protein S18 acetylase RimI-like enzyme